MIGYVEFVEWLHSAHREANCVTNNIWDDELVLGLNYHSETCPVCRV